MEKVTAFFRNMGLSEKETRTYLHLAKKGPGKASEIGHTIEVDRVQMYRILKNLQSKCIIECTFEYPTSYIAVPFEKIIDRQLLKKKEEAKNLETNMKELLSEFNLQKTAVSEPFTDRFMVLDGRNNVYSMIGQMIQEAKKALDIVTSNYGIISAYNAGLFDYGFNHPLKGAVVTRFLTNLSTIDAQIKITREILNRMKKTSLIFQYNIGDFGATGNFPRFIIKDENELIFFLKMAEESSSAIQRDTGLWTNNQVLVQAFLAFFGEMWNKSKDISDEIKEREKGH